MNKLKPKISKLFNFSKIDYNNPYTYKAKLIRVIDGDTIDLQVNLGFNIFVRERFRFAEINAFEISTEKGKLAKAFVERRFAENNNECLIKSEKQGKYGRWLAWIYFDDSDKTLNEELVEQDLAVWYDAHSKEKR